MARRKVILNRETGETGIKLEFSIDGTGKCSCKTGIGMLDHLVSQVAKHGMFDVKLRATGDLETGQHHLVEDVAIVLGQALDKALGKRQGIVRMGHAVVPMDEALAMVTIDIGGRGHATVEAPLEGRDLSGLDADLIRHFLESFANEAKLNLHAKVISGVNDHHKVEALFKALGRALDTATGIDERMAGGVPSTKGIIEGGVGLHTTDDSNLMALDEDEAYHVKQVSKDTVRDLALADAGAMLTARCVTYTPTVKEVETNSPIFIKALLTLKCANLFRLSTTSLSIGYYAGAAILLRSAFEALVYMHLFDDDPDEIRLWLKVELHPSMDAKQRAEDKRAQWDRAKDAFIKRGPDQTRERDLVKFLWDKTSHSSAVGLAQVFDLDFRRLLPDEFWAALESAGDDLGFALDLLAWRAVDGKTLDSEKYGTKYQEALGKEKVRFELVGRYDQDKLGLLSTMTLYLAQRLTYFAFGIFEVSDPEIRTDFDKWVQQVKSR